jgi:hypothetical protein
VDGWSQNIQEIKSLEKYHKNVKYSIKLSNKTIYTENDSKNDFKRDCATQIIENGHEDEHFPSEPKMLAKVQFFSLQLSLDLTK